MDFLSKRISQTREIKINAPLEAAFPLFGPIIEKEWAFGWDPQVLYLLKDSLVEERMIFKTKSSHHHAETEYIWFVSRYAPESAFIEYTVFTSERLWWITIVCRVAEEPQFTMAEITYIYSGLNEHGNLLNKKALETMFRNDLKDWEDAINYYLETGKCMQ